MTSSEPFCWKTLRCGEPIPVDAVPGGNVKKYGEVFIGRSGGQVGRITTKLDGFAPNQVRKMENFTYHGDSSWFGNKECEVLLSRSTTARPTWQPIKKHETVPMQSAVKAGETRTDGVTYVGRSIENSDYKGDIGKVSVDLGRMKFFWCESKKHGGHHEAEILVFDSIPVVVARPVQNTGQPVVQGIVQDPLGVAQQPAQPQVQAQVQAPERPRPVDVALPSAPTAFSGTNGLSQKQMEELRANPPLLDDWLTDQKEVKEYEERANKLREETQGMAYDMLDMETEYERTKKDFESGTQDLTSAQSRVQDLLSQRQAIEQKQSPDELCRILNANAQSAENSAYQVLEEALRDPNNLDGKLAEFKQAYLSQKTEAHKCIALSESLKKSRGAP